MPVNISINTNTVAVQENINYISVNDPNNPNIVDITQPITEVVEIITPGPQGPRGIPGPIPNTGSFATTGSNVFIGDQIIIGPLIVTAGITGSLFGTSSYALSSSYSTNINGTTNYVSKFTGDNTLGNSLIYDNGTNVGIGTTAPTAKLEVAGDIIVNGITIGKGSGSLSNNTVVGEGAGESITTGNINSFFGLGAGRFNTVGQYNAYIGQAAGYNTTSGSYNSFLGSNAGFYNTLGNYNTFIGLASGQFNTSGSGNTALGNWSGYLNTTGSYNTFVGYGTGYYIKAGDDNVFLGRYAGRYIGTGTTQHTLSTNSIFLGVSTRPAADNETNQIVVGYNATGLGSNTIVLGNDSVITTALKGNIAIGKTTPNAKLDVSGSVIITGSLTVTNGITGSLLGTASYAQNAGTASNILGGKATHIPFFITDTTLATSSLYQSGSGTIIINQDNATSANPEALYVWQPHPTSINVISGKGNLNNYLQLNIHNTNQGTAASSDVVATANNGDETTNYIDMGINSENFSGVIGGPNDAYLYSTGQHLHIGNTTPNKPIQFFVGGPDSNIDKKFELNADGQHNMTGSLEIDESLTVLGGITGSLFGTSSYALTASYAPSYLPLTGGTILGDVTVTGTASIAFLNVQFESASVIYSSGSNVFGDATNDTQTLNGTVLVSGSQQITGSLSVSQGITGTLFGTSSWAVSASWAPTQYIDTGSLVTTSSFNSFTSSYNTGSFKGTLAGTASWALNASTADSAINSTSASHAIIADNALAADYATIAGNGGVTSIIAGSGITLPFGGTGNVTIVSSGGGGVTIISGSAVTSSFINSDTWTFNHNLGTRTPTITVFDSNYNQVIPQNISLDTTSSATITFPTLESGFAIASTGGTTGTALSSSYSLFATYADSASYYPETDPIFAAKSASLATTGSNRFIGNQTITGSLIISSSNSATVIGPMRVTGSLLVSGSTTQIGNNTLTGNTSLTGSITVSGSQTYLGNLGLTGSFSVTGSTIQIGNNTLIGNTVLSGSISVSGSQTFKGSFDLTGSMVVSGSTAQFGNTTLVGNTTITGSMSLGGDILIYGDILPQVSSSYSLGSISQPWKSIYVQSGSINIQSDIPGGANAELINLGGDVSIQSAGFRVISGSYTPFRVDPTGRTRLVVPNIPANDIGAFSIIGNASGSYQPVINPSGMVHVTGNDAQAARITVDGFGTNIGTIYVGRHARGTAALPTPTLSGDTLVRFAGLGYATSSYFPVVGAVPTSLEFQATENYSTSSYGSRAAFYTYANGAVSRSLSAIIDATGITIPSSSLLFGTASWALNAQTASYVTSSNIVGTVLSSSYALTASYARDYVLTSATSSMLAPYVLTSITSSMSVATASYVKNAQTASYYIETDPIFTAKSGSFATTGSNTFRGNQTISGSITTSGSLTVNGPAIFNDQTVQITGSLLITGSGFINSKPILTSANTSSFQNGFGWYGAFCSTGSQTNPVANVSRSMQLDTVEHSNGVSIVSGSRITFQHGGVYNIQFSAQLQSTSAGDNLINIWFKKNGSNVARSNTLVNVAKQAGDKLVAAWNYIDTANANEYYEIAWQSADTGMQLHTDAATGNIPVTPSVIITATQVG